MTKDRNRLAAEHERSLIAATLMGSVDTARELLTVVSPAMFADERLARTWSALAAVVREAPAHTYLPDAVADEVAGYGADVPSRTELHELSVLEPSAVRGPWLARKVADDAARRRVEAVASPAVLERGRDLSTTDLAAGMMDELSAAMHMATDDDGRREAVSAWAVSGTNRPERLLNAAGEGGALLTVGNALVLAGEGGAAKSPLTLSTALSIADRPDGDRGPLHGGLFEAAGCSVLIATYEDTPDDCAYRLRECARTWWPADHDRVRNALERVHLLDMAARPLFGPTGFGGGVALYNARPGPLPGWDDLWRAVDMTGARVVVVDPALASYAADQNAAAPVREYLGELTTAAREHDCGVVLVCHTNKASRGSKVKDRNPFDPGAVAGSTHWTDAARGVCLLDWHPDRDAYPGARCLSICKSNYGPARVLCEVDPIRDHSGEICGFVAAGDWHKLTTAPAATNGTGTAAETFAPGEIAT